MSTTEETEIEPRAPEHHSWSHYHGRKITHVEHLTISAYWFATNFLWGALLVLMLPNEVRAMAPYQRVTALGMLTGLAAFVALTVPLVVGAMSDNCSSKYGRRRPYMVVGVAINLVGLMLMALVYSQMTPIPKNPPGSSAFLAIMGSPSFLLFLASYMIVQFGNNIATAAYSGVIPDLIPAEQRGAASGYMALMSQVGTLFGGVAVGFALSHRAEWIKYLVLGVVLLGVAAITIMGIKEAPLKGPVQKIQWRSYWKSLWIDPKKYPDFAWVWITRALVMLGFYSVLPFINYYLVDVIGIEDPDKAAPMLMGAILIASSISGIYGGYISDRIGRKRVVYMANMMIAVMVFAFIFCRTFEQVLIAGVIFGIGFGAYTSVDWALGTDVLPTKVNAAKEMAVWHVAMTLPQSISGPFAGFLIAIFGMTVEHKNGEDVAHYTTNGYAAVFVLCAVFFALGAYFLRNVRGVK